MKYFNNILLALLISCGIAQGGEYKVADDGVIRNSDGAFIPSSNTNSMYWREYQEWILDGGIPDPQYTLEELSKKLISAVYREADSRIDILLDTLPRRAEKMGPRLSRLLRKEIAGTISVDEGAELDFYDSIDDQIDAIIDKADAAELWLEDPARTREELEVYNPKINPWL